MVDRWLELLHLFFAFSFVGTLILLDWNGRAARATEDWSRRALLFGILYVATRNVGIGSLVMLGVFGNLLAPLRGWSMAREPWMWWVNGLWLAALLVLVIVVAPGARRLTDQARAGAAGTPDPAWSATLARYRFGAVALSVLYLALLGLMVFRWRS